MTETFNANDKAREAWPNLMQAVENDAFDMAEEFIVMGHTTREATSLVAHIFTRAAWNVAATGKIAAGGTPDPNLFRTVVEEVLGPFEKPCPECGCEERSTAGYLTCECPSSAKGE